MQCEAEYKQSFKATSSVTLVKFSIMTFCSDVQFEIRNIISDFWQMSEVFRLIQKFSYLII
jgi:hypothetical protein